MPKSGGLGKAAVDAAIAAHAAVINAHEGLYWRTTFESIDGYYEECEGAGEASVNQIRLHLKTGMLLNDYTILCKYPWEPIYPFTWDKGRRIKTRFTRPGNVVGAEAWLVTGWGGVWGATSPHLGFKVIDGTLYGTVADGTTESTLELATIGISDKVLVEAVFKPGAGCRFYVDGVDKGAITKNLPSGTSGADYMMYLDIKTTVATQKDLVLSEWIFLQEA